MTLLNLTGIASGEWVEISDSSAAPEAAQVLVSFDRLVNEGKALAESSLHLGLRLEPHHAVEEIAAYIGALSLIVIDFPAFTDGRGYSQARRLREEFGYRGELRAVGDILPDQARYMERCGFDSLVLAAEVDEEAVKAALQRYSYAYQPAADHLVTIAERRHRAVDRRKVS
jgi:uncharacterized protein (DUF934 family)